MLKVAIVGCGKIADGHVEEIQNLPHLAEVVAVCDLELLMAEQLAARYGIPNHSDDFAALLARHRPDVVHITTPPGSHLALTRMAVDAGCHVFVEKPVAPTFAQASELVDYARRAGRKLTVGYTYLFDPPALAMRELIQSGVLGDPVHVESFYGYNLSGQFGTALLRDKTHWVHNLPGGLIQNNIDHLVNKLVEFVRDDEPELNVHGAVMREARFGDARDNFVDELRVAVHGQKVTSYATFSARARPVGHFCRVYGTKNTMHVDYVGRTVTLDGAPTLPSAFGRLLMPLQQALQFAREGVRNTMRFARSDFRFFAGLNELTRRFYESIINGTEPPISYRDIVWLARLCEQIIDLSTVRKDRHVVGGTTRDQVSA